MKFYLINYDVVQKAPKEFLDQFDGFINPGAGDSFPRSVEEFSNLECLHSLGLEKFYQFILKESFERDVPYLGICSGAQHLALYHKSYLMPVKGYSDGEKHDIKYLEGSLSHFQAMDKDQQDEALQSCKFPNITFVGDTAHHYAAKATKLSPDLEIGAVSEDDILMSYAHTNGIRYATQFHPEHYYGH